jgi:signal transduction histidine kinase
MSDAASACVAGPGAAAAAGDAVRAVARPDETGAAITAGQAEPQSGGAGPGSAGPDVAELTEALRAVEECGRDAMTELRHMLELLAPAADGTEDALAPQPSLSRLGTLIDRVAFAGLPVEVTIGGDPHPLPPGIDVTAYRVVQEALTNALKHSAPGARAEVEVRYTGRNLRLEILTTGPSILRGDPAHPAVPDGSAGLEATTGSGMRRGLAGSRERVRVYGGDLYAGRRLGGGFRVRARIPLERP